MALPQGIRGILTDIEGTTTPVSFVYDVLFPFAAERIEQACMRAQEDPRISAAIARLSEEHGVESQGRDDLPAFGDGAGYARLLMAEDRKSTGLKALQGVIWEAGYRSGELSAQIYDDVPPALAAWRRSGASIRVFSSGSVLAQKLLFAHTDHGDILDCFDGYHDTTTGPKQQPESYAVIARAFELAPERILFLSDVVDELNAARDAGMKTILLRRPGNPPCDDEGHRAMADFRPLT